MIFDWLPFRFTLDTAMIAGGCLWSLALYIGLESLKERIIDCFNGWFNFAERSLYTSDEEFEKTRVARESQNAFYASIFSIIPFLIIGGLCNWGIQLGLGRSWAISMGLIACMACGIYELGKRDSLEK